MSRGILSVLCILSDFDLDIIVWHVILVDLNTTCFGQEYTSFVYSLHCDNYYFALIIIIIFFNGIKISLSCNE